VPVRLGQFLFGGLSLAAIRFQLPAAMITGWFLFSINRIFVVQTWRRVLTSGGLTTAIVELILKLFVLALKFAGGGPGLARRSRPPSLTPPSLPCRRRIPMCAKQLFGSGKR
jgi:hypothetical protein